MNASSPQRESTTPLSAKDPWRFLDIVIAFTAMQYVRPDLRPIMPRWEEGLIEIAVGVGVYYIVASVRRPLFKCLHVPGG
jgi:hypothetical protein